MGEVKGRLVRCAGVFSLYIYIYIYLRTMHVMYSVFNTIHKCLCGCLWVYMYVCTCGGGVSFDVRGGEGGEEDGKEGGVQRRCMAVGCCRG